MPASIELEAVVALEGMVVRLVERQASQATRRLSDSLAEQALLEDVLETSKPALPSARECPLRHRLLLTPFRYRKPHGSRFSSRFERGMFYGSRCIEGALVEGAYYGFVFAAGPARPFPRPTTLAKTLFHVDVRSPLGLRLQQQGDGTLQRRLRDPADYGFTQESGARMRQAGIACFEYHSARSATPLVQFGAFTCAVFVSTPYDQLDVTLEVTERRVVARRHDDNSLRHYHRAGFDVAGALPCPAL